MSDPFKSLNDNLKSSNQSLSSMNSNMANLKKQNEKLLENSIMQSEQFQEMNQKLAEANDVNKQMLKNQMEQYLTKKKQDSFKDLLFYTMKTFDMIDKINEPVSKYKLTSQYVVQLSSLLDIATEELTELNDKKESYNLFDKSQKLIDEAKNNEDLFNKSEFAETEKLETEYNQMRNRLEDLKNKKTDKNIKKPINNKKKSIGFFISSIIAIILAVITGSNGAGGFSSFVIFVFVILFFIGVFYLLSGLISDKKKIKKYEENTKLLDSDKISLDQEKEHLENSLNNHKYIQMAESLQNKYSSYFKINNDVRNLLLKYQDKWKVSVTE